MSACTVMSRGHACRLHEPTPPRVWQLLLGCLGEVVFLRQYGLDLLRHFSWT